MLDYQALKPGSEKFRRTVSELTIKYLRIQSDEMIDYILELISDCNDSDVTFVPEDPQAYDSVAATAEEVKMPWTLGHVIVHTTASSEESAALAAELARGVADRGGRSRSEVHWTTIKTIQQCRHRLEESRRMRLGSLDMWPDEPYERNVVELKWIDESVNAYGRFLLGLIHEYSHLEQIEDIVSQSKVRAAETVQ